MNPIRSAITAGMLALALVATGAQAQAQDALRKNLESRLPQMGKIDEIGKSPMPGLMEIRIGSDIYYTDPEGNFLIHGQLIDTRQQRNLTEERVEKLTAIDFEQLPMKDAFVVTRGTGKRKIAVFQDPNCGYCKRFERDLQKVDNVTIYMFLYPILGPDSMAKSRSIWCSRDKGKAWQDWMVRDQPIPAASGCDTAALERNLEFGKRNKISGTPTLFFTSGNRVPGAIPAAQVEKLLAQAK